MTLLNTKNEYIKMTVDELYRDYITFVLSDERAEEMHHILKSSNRYLEDAEFRVMIDFAKILIDSKNDSSWKTDYECRITASIDIIDRAGALKMWQLVANAWNNLAICYVDMVLYERALECYMHAIRVEEEHGLYILSPTVYSNLVSIYVQIGDLEKAMECVEKAAVLLEQHKEKIPRYWDKYIGIYSRYLYVKIRSSEYELHHLKPYYDKIMEVDEKKLNYNSKCMKINSEFYYGFFHYETERFRKILQLAKKVFGEQQYILFCHECVALSKETGRDESYCIRELIEMEDQGVRHLPLVNMQTCDILIEYFERQKAEEKVSEYRVKYIEEAKKHLDNLSKQQDYAIQTIAQLMMSDELKRTNNIKNVEFKLIAEESLNTKRKLEKAYKRIEVVGELGKKIIATTDLNEVVNAIYRVIKENVPVDFFALTYANEEEEMLESIAVYYKDVLNENFKLPFDDERSSLVECYRAGEIIKFNQPQYEWTRRQYYDNDDMSSCIFVPLIVAEKVIGVFTIQSIEKFAFDGESFEFLCEIEPYLAIALNNGIKSWNIEREIENRNRIQRELEEANAILEKISSVDGLTQISSRRDFEGRFKNMIEEARKDENSIAVFMLDIDYFKRYNDTYGHLEGDRALKEVAHIFNANMEKAGGIAARFGGEEFIGAVAGLREERICEISQNICDEVLGLRIENRGAELGCLSVSVGAISAEHLGYLSSSVLMRHADECLYRAKSSGRNRFVFQVV